MADREAVLSDKSKQHSFPDVFFAQKQNHLYCDVILKVCDKEIHAHSNILAASSQYFENFLSQDLPRLFSQHSPQIIEIQIDGNDPNQQYEKAVNSIIDFIYTGVITVKDDNVAQVYEISQIMDIESIINFCENFIQGRVQYGTVYHAASSKLCHNVLTNTDISSVKHGSMLDAWSAISKSSRTEKDAALLSKLRSRKVASVSTQTVPIIPLDELTESHPQEKCTARKVPTSTKVVSRNQVKCSLHSQNKQGRREEVNVLHLTLEDKNDAIDDEAGKTLKERQIITRSGRKVIPKLHPEDSFQVAALVIKPQSVSDSMVSNEQKADASNNKIYEPSPKQNSEKLMGDDNDNKNSESNLETGVLSESNLVNHLTSKSLSNGDFSNSQSTDMSKFDSSMTKVLPILSRPPANPGKKVPKSYTCDTCAFITSSVRDMSSHTMTHKLEEGICFYCDLKVEDREELLHHVDTHKGVFPFICRTCQMTFKTRTMLNLHLPKHSEMKPFSCEVCSMTFKWKHSLKCHMTTHSNKKEHLCDTCGFTTAWPAQLKSHKLIHSGKTFKCEWPGCGFQSTKKQNLKHHLITHTGEKNNVCEICGQKFSLKRNMRRHMLLHFSNRQQQCDSCAFSSTRLDKLKEHMFKQHGKGTPPERRMKVADIQKLNLTVTASGTYVSMPESGETEDESLTALDAMLSDEVTSQSGSKSTVVAQSLNNDTNSLNKEGEETESYTILNNLLHSGAEVGKTLPMEQDDGMTLLTAQQVEGEESGQIETLLDKSEAASAGHYDEAMDVTTEAGTHTVQIVQGDVMSFADASHIIGSDQTIQIIDGNNKIQLVKVEDLAQFNLSSSLTFCTQDSVQVIQESESVSFVDSQGLGTAIAAGDAIEGSLLGEQTNMNHVLIEDPAGNPQPVHVLSPATH